MVKYVWLWCVGQWGVGQRGVGQWGVGQWGVGARGQEVGQGGVGVGSSCGRHYATMGVSGVWGSAALGCGAVGFGMQGAVWGRWGVGCERGELVWAALWALSWVGPCGFEGWAPWAALGGQVWARCVEPCGPPQTVWGPVWDVVRVSIRYVRILCGFFVKFSKITPAAGPLAGRWPHSVGRVWLAALAARRRRAARRAAACPHR